MAPPRRGLAPVLLSLFLVVGLLAAAGAGWKWTGTVNGGARQSFDQRAAGVASRVTMALQGATDLTTSTRALIGQNPDLTNVELAGWFSALSGSRQQSTSGVAYIESVSASEFYYFRVAMAADPTSTLSSGVPFTVTPSSAQAPYCFTRLQALRSSLQHAAGVALPPGLDWCDTSVNGALERVA